MFFKKAKKKASSCEGSRKLLLLPDVSRRSDARYLKIEDGTSNRQNVNGLNKDLQGIASHVNITSSQTQGNETLEEDGNLPRISKRKPVKPRKKRKNMINPNESEDVLLDSMTYRSKIDEPCILTTSENPVSDVKALEKGGSGKQFQSILQALKMSRKDVPKNDNEESINVVTPIKAPNPGSNKQLQSIVQALKMSNKAVPKNDNEEILKVSQFKNPSINDVTPIRALSPGIPNAKCPNKDERKNSTIPEVKYDMTDNKMSSKVFLSLTKESRKLALPQEYGKEASKKNVYNYEGPDARTLDQSISSCSLDSVFFDKKQAILSRTTHQSMSTCSLDSALIDKKQAILSRTPQSHLRPQRHRSAKRKGQGTRSIKDKYSTDETVSWTFGGVIDELMCDTKTNLSNLLGNCECTTISE